MKVNFHCYKLSAVKKLVIYTYKSCVSIVLSTLLFTSIVLKALDLPVDSEGLQQPLMSPPPDSRPTSLSYETLPGGLCCFSSRKC